MKTFNLDNLNKSLLDIIERKHKELQLGRGYQHIFSKIKDFEGNAIGQIGEEYAKNICRQICPIVQDTETTIHDEYDICTESGKTIEVKTSRKGRTTNTFQFNGINPTYTYDFLLCIGICEDKVLYRIFNKSSVKRIHAERKWFITEDNFKRQLVQMNPDNMVSYKLTLNIKDLYSIDNLPAELQKLLCV